MITFHRANTITSFVVTTKGFLLQPINNKAFVDLTLALDSRESLDTISEKAFQVLQERKNRLSREELIALKALSERINALIPADDSKPFCGLRLRQITSFFSNFYLSSTEVNYCPEDISPLLEGLLDEESQAAFKEAFGKLSINLYSYMLKELIPLVQLFPSWKERIGCLEKSILLNNRFRTEYRGFIKGLAEEIFSGFCKEAISLLSLIPEPNLHFPALKSFMILNVHRIYKPVNETTTGFIKLLNSLPSEVDKLQVLQRIDTFHEENPSCNLNYTGMLALLAKIPQGRFDEFFKAFAIMGDSYIPVEDFAIIFSDEAKWPLFSELIFSVYNAGKIKQGCTAFSPPIKENLFETIKKIPNEHYPLVFGLLSPINSSDLFDPTIHNNHGRDLAKAHRETLNRVISLLKSFEKMSSDDKTLFLQIRDSLLKKGMNHFEILEISLDLASIQPEKRMQFFLDFKASGLDLPFHATTSLLKIKAFFCSHSEEYIDLLKQVPPDQLDLFFKNMAGLIQDLGNPEFETSMAIEVPLPSREDVDKMLCGLVDKFKQIPPSQWGNVSKAFALTKKSIENCRGSVIHAFTSIDPSKWDLFSQTILVLLPTEEKACEKSRLLDLVEKISTQDLKVFITLIKISTPEALSLIKKTLSSENKRQFLLQGVDLCLRSEMTPPEIEFLITSLVNATEPQRIRQGNQIYSTSPDQESKLTRLQSLIKPEMTAKEVLAFLPYITKPNLWKICKPLSDEGMTSLLKVADLCLRPEMTDNEFESMIVVFSQDPQETLTKLLAYIKPETTSQEILFFLPFVTDENLWSSYLSKIAPLVKNSVPLEIFSEKFKTLHASRKEMFFSLITPCLEGASKKRIEEAVRFLESIVAYPAESLKFMKSHVSKKVTSAVQEGRQPIEATKEAVRELFYSILRSSLYALDLEWGKRQSLLALAKAVLKDPKLLQGHKEQDPLMKSAIQTILWLTGNKYEPHYVHAHLRAVRSSGHIPLRETIRPASVLLSDPFCKVTLELDLDGIQKGLQRIQQKEKSGEEFQAWIEHVNQTKQPDSPFLGPTVFVDLFQNLNERLQTVSPPDRDLQAAVQQTAKWLTDPTHFCGKLLQKSFESATPSEQKLLIRLYEIAAAILKKSNTLAPEQALSPREEAIMTWLRLIEQCSTGQEEGIHVCYNALRVSGEIEGKIEETSILPGAEKTENFLAFEVQKVMEDVVAFPETLEALKITAAGALKQMVHQTRYMRGILALVYEDCGLDYPIEVDPHGGTVSRELMARSRETILEVIFRQTTKHLISSLKKDINAHLFENNLYDNINRFLAAHGVTDTRQIWKMGAEGVVELSDFGAITLLEKGGYLHADLGRYKHYLDLQNQIEETEKALHTLRNTTPLDPAIIEKAKAHLDTSRKAMGRALRAEDPHLESIKQKHREAKENYEELLIKEQSAQETLTRANSLKSLIASLEKQLDRVRIRLEGEALQEEVLPPIAVIQERLIESTLPADIQFLEDRWKTAQAKANSADASEANSLQELANQHKKTFEMALSKYQDHLQN